MSVLEKRIKALIRAEGPIPLNVYMQICLHDPDHGYYAANPGLGKDFVTAPEISQIFGELTGLWCAHEWRRIGKPSPCLWIEAGPGRGVLAQDALRAMQVDPEFLHALRPVMIESSPVLKAQQQQRMDADKTLWVQNLDEVPKAAGELLIGNEFLDCLPIRRYLNSENSAWREQRVGIGTNGELQMGLSSPLPVALQASAGEWTLRPALEAMIAQLAERFNSCPGRALFFDYHGESGALRAFSNGKIVSPLSRPGKVDLTASVDFDALARLARTAGLDVAGPIPQGLFLKTLGAPLRMQALKEKFPDKAQSMENSLHRLLDPQDMGKCFAVICLSSTNLPAPAGFEEEKLAAGKA